MTTPDASHFATWSIAALAVCGVVVRPWRVPEWSWALLGACVLVLSGLLPMRDAVVAVGKGLDVYLFLAGMRGESIDEDRAARPVAFEHAMRRHGGFRAFGLNLRLRFAERQRFALGEQVCHQKVVLPCHDIRAGRIQRLAEADEIACVSNENRPNEDGPLARPVVLRRSAIRCVVSCGPGRS